MRDDSPGGTAGHAGAHPDCDPASDGHPDADRDRDPGPDPRTDPDPDADRNVETNNGEIVAEIHIHDACRINDDEGRGGGNPVL